MLRKIFSWFSFAVAEIESQLANWTFYHIQIFLAEKQQFLYPKKFYQKEFCFFFEIEIKIKAINQTNLCNKRIQKNLPRHYSINNPSECDYRDNRNDLSKLLCFDGIWVKKKKLEQNHCFNSHRSVGVRKLIFLQFDCLCLGFAAEKLDLKAYRLICIEMEIDWSGPTWMKIE